MIEYDVDLIYQSDFTMEMGYTATSLTQQILFPTQSVRVNSYPAGLGPVFFAGFAILVTGIALTTVVAAAKTMSAPSVASTELCRQCGARIPRGSKFCDKCGTAALRNQ
jgi:ribosomal protein L40E